MTKMTSTAINTHLPCSVPKGQQSMTTTVHVARKRWIVLTEEHHEWLAESFDPIAGPAAPEFRDKILDLAYTLINRTLDKYQWMSTARLLNDVIQSLKEDRAPRSIIRLVFFSACLRIFFDIYVEYGWTQEKFQERVLAEFA